MRKITQVELQPAAKTRLSARKASTGPWYSYSMSVGRKTYIGRTSHRIEDRLIEHNHRLVRGNHSNWMLQELHDQGHKFTIKLLATHDTLEEARVFEDAAIKNVPVNQSLNIRQRRPEAPVRPDYFAPLELRTRAVDIVNGLLDEGYSLAAACREVAPKLGFSDMAIYSWCRGVAHWQGQRLNSLKKEQK